MRPRPLRSATVHHDETTASRPLHGTAVHHDKTTASQAPHPLREE